MWDSNFYAGISIVFVSWIILIIIIITRFSVNLWNDLNVSIVRYIKWLDYEHSLEECIDRKMNNIECRQWKESWQQLLHQWDRNIQSSAFNPLQCTFWLYCNK